MKIVDGLLFLEACELKKGHQPPVGISSVACLPVRNISYMNERLYDGEVYTAIHMNNGDEVVADACIPDLIQLITDAGAMNLFGYVGLNIFPNPEVVMKGSDLKVLLERTQGSKGLDLTKGGIVGQAEQPTLD